MKLMVAAFSLIIVASGQALPERQPFGLKGDLLGESLLQFTDHNSREGVGTIHDVVVAIRYPICSGPPIIGELGRDENWANIILKDDKPPNPDWYTVCVISGGRSDASDTGTPPTIGGAESRNLHFIFAGNELIEISAFIGREDFSTVQRGLIDKYGPPSSSLIEQFQNSYGAKFQGTVATWNSGDSVIEIQERLTGQDNLVSLISIYKRTEYRLYHRMKPPVADPAKDL